MTRAKALHAALFLLAASSVAGVGYWSWWLDGDPRPMISNNPDLAAPLPF